MASFVCGVLMLIQFRLSAPVASTIVEPELLHLGVPANYWPPPPGLPKRAIGTGVQKNLDAATPAVRTLSSAFRSSLIISCCHSVSPFEWTLACPVTAFTPPAWAEITNFSRFCPKLTTAQHRSKTAETTVDNIRRWDVFLTESPSDLALNVAGRLRLHYRPT